MKNTFAGQNKVASQLVNKAAEVLKLSKKPKIVKYAESRTCTYFVLELPGDQQIPKKVFAILYKIRKAEDAHRNPSENVYNSLLKIARLCYSTSKLVVPRPIAKLPEMNGVIIELISGTTLDRYFPRNYFCLMKRKQMLAKCFRDLGSAIGMVHAQTGQLGSRNAKLYFELKMESIKNKICGSRLKSLRTIKKTLRLLDDVASTITWSKNPCSLIHGDLVHNNIIITDDGKIAIIDWAESRMDSPYHDISRFTIRTLLDYSYNFKSAPNFLTSLNYDFLNSYFNTYKNLTISNKLYYFYCTFNTLQFVSFLYNDPRNYLSLAPLRDVVALFLLNQFVKKLL